MEQFNSNTYKKQTATQEFTHSCLGKFIILVAISCILLLVAAVTCPSDSMMRWQMEDNIRECLKASDSIQNDVIDFSIRLLIYATISILRVHVWASASSVSSFLPLSILICS